MQNKDVLSLSAEDFMVESGKRNSSFMGAEECALHFLCLCWWSLDELLVSAEFEALLVFSSLLLAEKNIGRRRRASSFLTYSGLFCQEWKKFSLQMKGNLVLALMVRPVAEIRLLSDRPNYSENVNRSGYIKTFFNIFCRLSCEVPHL